MLAATVKCFQEWIKWFVIQRLFDWTYTSTFRTPFAICSTSCCRWEFGARCRLKSWTCCFDSRGRNLCQSRIFAWCCIWPGTTGLLRWSWGCVRRSSGRSRRNALIGPIWWRCSVFRGPTNRTLPNAFQYALSPLCCALEWSFRVGCDVLVDFCVFFQVL